MWLQLRPRGSRVGEQKTTNSAHERDGGVTMKRTLCVMVLLALPALANDPETGFDTAPQLAEAGLERGPCDDPPAPPGQALGIGRRCARNGSSSGIARGDFNGDGFGDLAIGVPHRDTSGVANSGAVVIVYGSSSGLNAAGAPATALLPAVPASQLWTQSTFGVASASEAGDRFGAALASGDFNGDTFSDLAIGVPGERQVIGGTGYSGMVVVIYGSAVGLTTDARSGLPLGQSFSLANLDDGQLLNFAASSETDFASNSQAFGSSLAWGDFNADGVGDLAVGAPRATTANVAGAAGTVGVLYGQQSIGLSATVGNVWTQDTFGIDNTSESGDRFGETLAAGDFDADGDTDLAIGIPGEVEQVDLTTSSRGAVAVIYSRLDFGLTTVDSFYPLSFFRSPFGSAFKTLDVGIGSALTAGDFNGDGRADLAVGAQYEDVGAADSGGVYVVTAVVNPLVPGQPRVVYLDQNVLFNSGNESGDRFGYSLAAGDFDGDGRADLAIGAPFEDISTTTDAGSVYVAYGSSSGLLNSSGNPAGRAPQIWHQDSTGIDDVGEGGDLFGQSLTAWNFGRNLTFPLRRFADLAIGVPLENLGSVADAGAVNVIYGSAFGLTSGSDQFWTQTLTGAGTSAAGDQFGLALY
jgi:hypothetical protein